MARFGNIDTQYFDSAGDPLAYGKLYFYESGTTTPKTTYADVNLSIPNTNPVTLYADGRQPSVFFNGTARVVLTDSDSVQVGQPLDPVGDTAAASQFGAWNSLRVYNKPEIVAGSDGYFYESITNGNQDNDPVTDTVNWSKIVLIKVWNANETYADTDVVFYGDLLYTSLSGSNLNNNPSTDTVNWRPSIEPNLPDLVNSAIGYYTQSTFFGR